MLGAVDQLRVLRAQRLVSGRRLAVDVQAKKKNVHARIAQNHNKNSPKILFDTDKLYRDRNYLPDRVFGPIKVDTITGKGRGLVTTAEVRPGDLLLVSEPLAFVKGPVGTTLKHKDLLDAVQRTTLSPADKLRLSLLYDGTPASSKQPVSLTDFQDADKVARRAAEKAAAASKGFGAAAAASRAAAAEAVAMAETVAASDAEFTPTSSTTSTAAAAQAAARASPSYDIAADVERLEAILKFNAHSYEHDDLAAATCRGEKPSAFIGLWPEYGLMNHSCSPNTVTVVIGDRLIVRAASRIPAGREVTVSYLTGMMSAVPLAERRKVLQNAYGFETSCWRTMVEESQPAEVQQHLAAIHDWLSSSKVLQKVPGMISTRDTAGLDAVRAEAESRIAALEEELTKREVAADVKVMLRACVYGVYELVAVCKDDASAGSDEALPAQLVPLMASMAPGSDGHLFLAADWMLRAAQKSRAGLTSKEVEQRAAKECIAAHIVRYGKASDTVLTQLITARAKYDNYLGRYNLDAPGAPPPTAPASRSAVTA